MPITPKPTKHFVQRIVYGWAYDGHAAYKNSNVKFILNKEEVGFTIDTVMSARAIYAPTDEDGYFEQALWCDEDSEVPIDWRAFYPTADNQTEPPANAKPKDFSLTFGNGEPISIGLAMKLGVGVPPDQETTILQAVYAYILVLIADGTIGGGSGGGSPAPLKFICTPRSSDITTAIPEIYSETIIRHGTIVEVIASLSTPAQDGIFTIDVEKNGASIFSTPVTIDAEEKTSMTAAVAAVISDAEISRGDELSVSITNAADGTARGLIVYIVLGAPPEADDESPTVPTGLNLTGGTNSFSGTYTNASDNVAVTTYHLRLNNGGLTDDIRNIGTAKPFSVTGLTAGNYQVAIRAVDAAGNQSNWSADVPVTVTGAVTNWAAAANGGTVEAASSAGDNFPAASTINGDRTTGGAWAGGGGWSSLGGLPQTIVYTFAAPRSISEINVFTLRDNPNDASTVTFTETFTSYGVTDFAVEYWNGTAWINLANVSANDKVGRHLTFSPVSFTMFRLVITDSIDEIARLVEVEAFGV